MLIKELRPRDVLTIEATDTLRNAAECLTREDVGALTVFDAHGPRAVFSERDLARAVADGVDVEITPVQDYMTERPVIIGAEASLMEAIDKMNEFGCRHLLVEDDGAYEMLSMRDILLLAGEKLSEI